MEETTTTSAAFAAGAAASAAAATTSSWSVRIVLIGYLLAIHSPAELPGGEVRITRVRDPCVSKREGTHPGVVARVELTVAEDRVGEKDVVGRTGLEPRDQPALCVDPGQAATGDDVLADDDARVQGTQADAVPHAPGDRVLRDLRVHERTDRDSRGPAYGDSRRVARDRVSGDGHTRVPLAGFRSIERNRRCRRRERGGDGEDVATDLEVLVGDEPTDLHPEPSPVEHVLDNAAALGAGQEVRVVVQPRRVVVEEQILAHAQSLERALGGPERRVVVDSDVRGVLTAETPRVEPEAVVVEPRECRHVLVDAAAAVGRYARSGDQVVADAVAGEAPARFDPGQAVSDREAGHFDAVAGGRDRRTTGFGRVGRNVEDRKLRLRQLRQRLCEAVELGDGVGLADEPQRGLDDDGLPVHAGTDVDHAVPADGFELVDGSLDRGRVRLRAL